MDASRYGGSKSLLLLSIAWAFPIFLLSTGLMVAFAGSYCNGQGCEGRTFTLPGGATILTSMMIGATGWLLATIAYFGWMLLVWRSVFWCEEGNVASPIHTALRSAPFVMLGTLLAILAGQMFVIDTDRLASTFLSFKWLLAGLLIGGVGSLCGIALSFALRSHEA